MKDQRAIFLCGFMGAGKSSLGKALAKALGWPLLDTDQLLEERFGPIPQIFAQQGEGAFRQMEAQLARELAGKQGAVIATGGGFVLSEAVQEALEGCRLVYLAVPFETCYERIRGSNRPLVQRNSPQQLAALYEQRDAVYRRVCSILARNQGPLEESVAQLLKQVKA